LQWFHFQGKKCQRPALENYKGQGLRPFGAKENTTTLHKLSAISLRPHLATKNPLPKQREPYWESGHPFCRSERRYFHISHRISRFNGNIFQDISTTQHFFDLGGTSIDVIALKTNLDKKFQIDASVTWIFQYPTIKDLAKQIDRTIGVGVGKSYDPIVPLQVTGNKPPIFVVHPGVGEVLIFVELAKTFRGDRPFYAFRARGFNDNEEYFQSMEEMADTYTQVCFFSF
jgi:acyl carrier protein